jgi:hypothetical protein
MIGPSKKREPVRLRALILLCALAGFFLSSSATPSDSTLCLESAALNGVGFNAHLSLNDSAIAGLEKRISNVESKQYRRQLQSAPASSRGELARTYTRDLWPSAFQSEPACSAAAISPPADRAPPTVAL